ncbi:MAG: 50S ribosomal protein L18 [Pirellulaceae bacterium]|jgi:large subunit ribosomal protein L18|nr:50S ribosomal protein L18 [Pirellulaceae bacterium]
MGNKQKFIGKQRLRRKQHVRHRIRGSQEQPRLTVFRSHRHLCCQVINDLDGTTIASASTLDKTLSKKISYGGNCDAAKVVGTAIAERAIKAGVTRVSFDRGPCQYHGRLAALADAAREGGLEF